ncbi:MAG: hypothetical protein ACI8RZ_007859 [Myxococcota bacterium]|jgi:hypothetical protein
MTASPSSSRPALHNVVFIYTLGGAPSFVLPRSGSRYKSVSSDADFIPMGTATGASPARAGGRWSQACRADETGTAPVGGGTLDRVSLSPLGVA